MILCLSQFAHLFVERRHFDGQHQTCQHLLTIFVYTPTFLPRFSLCLFHEWKFFATYRSYDQSQVVSDVIRHLFFLNRSKGVEKNENIISEKKNNLFYCAFEFDTKIKSLWNACWWVDRIMHADSHAINITVLLSSANFIELKIWKLTVSHGTLERSQLSTWTEKRFIITDLIHSMRRWEKKKQKKKHNWKVQMFVRAS